MSLFDMNQIRLFYSIPLPNECVFIMFHSEPTQRGRTSAQELNHKKN